MIRARLPESESKIIDDPLSMDGKSDREISNQISVARLWDVAEHHCLTLMSAELLCVPLKEGAYGNTHTTEQHCSTVCHLRKVPFKEGALKEASNPGRDLETVVGRSPSRLRLIRFFSSTTNPAPGKVVRAASPDSGEVCTQG